MLQWSVRIIFFTDCVVGLNNNSSTQICAERWVRQHFPVAVFPIVCNRSCSMLPSAVMMENYCLASRSRFWAFYSNRWFQFKDLLLVAFLINGFTRFYKLIQHAVLRLSNTEHYLGVMDLVVDLASSSNAFSSSYSNFCIRQACYSSSKPDWKRRTRIVAFQRKYVILKQLNNNQVTQSLAKPHKLVIYFNNLYLILWN